MKLYTILFVAVLFSGNIFADEFNVPKKVTLSRVEIFPSNVKVTRIIAVTQQDNIEVTTPAAFISGLTPVVVDKIDKSFASAHHMGAYIVDNYCDGSAETLSKRTFNLNTVTGCNLAATDGKVIGVSSVRASFLTEGLTTTSTTTVMCN